MIVDGHICTEIGDVLYITTQVPIIATTSLLTFTDSIIGTTGTRFFNKLFQYSPDGIKYTEWQELSNTNLAKIEFEDWNTPMVNLRYERAGTDPTGDLEFNGIIFGGTAITYSPDSQIGSVSLFKDIIYNNPEVFQLALNLTKKLYESGIVPQYIERDTEDDTDYIAFWKTVAHYFALFSIYTQQFKNIYFIREWLLQYVEQYGLFFNGTEEMADIQYAIANLYDEYRKRGTAMVVIPKGTFLLDGSETIIDGEYLRLIGWNGYDDFIFQLRKKQFVGWWINKCSPNYKGLTHTGVQINKAPENTEDVLDLSKYTTDGSIVIDGSKSVVQLGSGETLSFIIPISINQDYELTFWCKQSLVAGVGMLKVAGAAYNHYGSIIGVLQDTTGTVNGIFISSLRTADNTVYYFVRIILYKSTTSQVNTPTNMNQGVNLRSIPGQEEMYWWLQNNNSGGTVNLWDIKCRPLRTAYSTGFVQTGNLIDVWRKNNNGRFNDDQINDLAKKYLFPYNSKQLTTAL